MNMYKHQPNFLWALVLWIFVAPAAAFGDDALPAPSKDMFNIDAKDVTSVELQADQVKYSTGANKAVATGNVVVTAGTTTMTADQIELDRGRQEGQASGHLYIDASDHQVDADAGTYNFNNHSGSFTNARIYHYPYQIKGKVVGRLSPTHMDMKDGYITTSDHDDPFFRFVAKKIDVYPGDKAIARGVKIYLGKVPIFYWPKYTQNLKERPWIIVTPGKTKDFGYFLLTQVRMKVFNDDRLTLHLDYRERKDFASGFDYRYNTQRYGSGIVRTYYTNERSITTKHLWQTTPQSIKGHERYLAEWRHKWKPDEKTDILVQYFRMRDPDFLKEYFERRYRQDPNINTYFLLTRVLPKGTLSFNIDASRVNRYARGVERLPEVRYELGDTEIGNTGFYGQTTNTLSNLTHKIANPESHKKTLRFDTNNRISYPTKISFVEFKPYVGGQNTFYSRTADLSRQNIIRGVFFTGADASTQVYRIWNVHKNLWGTPINGLRHVVRPSAAYFYQGRPTFPSSRLNQFDAIDTLENAHKVTLSLENKLQTKNDDRTNLDLLRTIVSSDFALKENPTKGGFGPVNSQIEFKPNRWLEFRGDTSYDHYNDRIASANFDTYIKGGEKWAFDISRRYTHGEDELITAELEYKINQKWRFKIYEQFVATSGTLKEEDYVLTRDLHEWEVAMEYHQLRGGGADILLTFTLKAFPNMNLDIFSTGFNKRKAGSQSSP